MDEDRNPNETEREPEAPAEVAPAPVEPTQPSSTEVFFPSPSTGKEAWRGGGSGCGPRARLYLMIVAGAGLVAILLVGLSVLRRGVWVTMDQGRQAVVQNLPYELPPSERQRIIKNLDRFRALLEASDDPYPMMGDFMTRVRAVLKDNQLTVNEVGGLNAYIERMIEESGIPPLQLGFRISDFGFRICSHAFSAPGRTVGIPKFEIRNSKLSRI